jgi:hypothetical protein
MVRSMSVMAMLRQSTPAETTLQAPEHLAGEFSYPTPVSAPVNFVLVVFVENAANKHSLSIVLGGKEVDETDSFRIGLAPPAAETR